MQHKSLRQILTWVTFIGLLPMAILLALLIYQGQRSAREEAVSDLNQLTLSLSKQYEMQISDAEYAFKSLGGVASILEGDRATCEAWLAKNMPAKPGINTWFRLAPDGTVTCASNTLPDDAALDITFDPQSARIYDVIRVGEVRESASTGKHVLSVNKAYWNDGNPFQLVVTFDADWFLKAFSQYAGLEGARAFIIDYDGNALLQLPDYKNAYRGVVPTFKRLSMPENAPITHPIEAGVDGSKRLVSTLIMHRFSDGRALFLSTSVSPGVLFSTAHLFIALGVGTLVLGVLGVVIAQHFLFGRYLAAPITAILEYSKNAANQRNHKAVSLPSLAPIEILEIADAVSTMAEDNDDRAAALSEALQNLELAQDIAQMGHWRIDLKANTLDWSDGVYKLHGLERQTFFPDVETAINLYHPEDRDDVQRAIEDAMRSHQPFEFEKRIIRSDGSFLYVSSRGQLTFDRNGAPIAVFGTIIDIDAPKQAQRELKRAQGAAQQLADARASFVASVTHEVRTPLTAMLGIVDGFRHEHLTPDQLRQIDLLDASGQMLMNVIGDLLDSASVDAGAIRLVERPIDPLMLLNTCFATFQTAYRSTDIAFSQVLTGTPPDTALLDGQRLRQVTFNLLGNAFKHTRSGKIVLGAHFSDDSMTISVEDTGSGIAPSKQSQIFKRFYQGGGVDDIQRPGTGLGLHIVKTIVGQMGGEISVSSEPGKGSCFRVTVPLKSCAQAAGSAPGAAIATKKVGQVLLVEDNPVNQKLLMAFLNKIECPFVVQSDGQYAVEWLLAQAREELPVLALIDVNMPRLNGIELCEFIRKQLPGGDEMPLYLVTADMLAGHENEIKRLEIDGTIPKPIDFAALRSVVDQHVERSAQSQSAA